MIKKCDNCGVNILINSFKGITRTKVPCSWKCFIEICKKDGQPLSSTVVNFEENKEEKAYRSVLEAKVAKLFEEKKVPYLYEPYILSYKQRNKKHFYLPDFYLPRFNMFIEVKGDIWGPGAYTKYINFSKKIPILLITSDIYKLLKNEGRTDVSRKYKTNSKIVRKRNKRGDSIGKK